jgi:hypothetical protein
MSKFKAAIRKSIMYGFSIGFSNDSQILAKFFNKCPIADASVGLRFCADRIVDNLFKLFLFKIGAAYHNAIFKVVRGFHKFSLHNVS